MEKQKPDYVCSDIGIAFVIVLIFPTIICIANKTPHTPWISTDSVALQNINISSDQVTADWNFNISIENTNKIGFSYKFKASLYYYYTDRFRDRNSLPDFVADAISPTLSQGGENKTTFTARFEGVSVPIDKKLMNEGGGRFELSNVSLELKLKGDVEPVPKKSLSWIMRSAVRSLSVYCSTLKIGILSDSTTGVAAGIYYGKNIGHCYSDWNTFPL